MSILSLLFSFKGRIGRGGFWLGMGAPGIVLLSIPIAIFYGIASHRGGNGSGAFAFALFAIIPAVFVAIWIGCAVITKRLHDRDKSIKFLPLVMAPYVVPMLFNFILIAGIKNHEIAVFLRTFQPILFALLGVLSLVQLWAFVELGVLPGTDGPNRFDRGFHSGFKDGSYKLPEAWPDHASHHTDKASPNGMEAAMAAVTAAARNVKPAQTNTAFANQRQSFGQAAPAQFGRLNTGGASGGFGRKV
jgi:uncharacterized membrane protein YhaH (DUF805 family)